MGKLFEEVDHTAGRMNQLFYGDNLTIMGQYMKTASVDLIYLDPPFNSQRSYNLIYKQLTGLPVPEQEEAFCDAWEMDEEKIELMRTVPLAMQESGLDTDVISFWNSWIRALRTSQPKLLAYLLYMSIRLLHMYRLLKPTGSLFLHCDPTASHYIKVFLDAIFGHNNIRNEIIWCYTGPGSPGVRQFLRKHDVIFWYTKGKTWTFNVDDVRIPHSDKTKENYKKGLMGSGFVGADHVIHEKGKVPEDWWELAIAPRGKDYLGYPTQKPLKLLDRIIKAASNEGDVIFDPFCGCGTTLYAAHMNKRKWIGCDIAILSVQLVKEVLQKRYGLQEGRDFEVNGVPTSVDGARLLFEHDARQFQHWAVELAGGFCSNRASGDRGIDGRIYFEGARELRERGPNLRSMVISVKGGKLAPAFVRELRGTLEREQDTDMAGFISLLEPTKGMRDEAVRAGFFEFNGNRYPRLQLRTVGDLLHGKTFETPTRIQKLEHEKQSVLPI